MAGAAERLYWRIAADRVAAALPDLVGEAALVRRYGVPRGVVHRALLQAMGRGGSSAAPPAAGASSP